MKYENEILYYHSEYKGDKKSRYTVAGLFNQNNTLSIAYARRDPLDNFSKKYGRSLSTLRLGYEGDTMKYKRVVEVDEVSRAVFISEARKFINK